MKLSEVLSKEAIIPELTSSTKESVIGEISSQIAKTHPGLDKGEIATVLLEREKLGSTGIELGVAIPHAKLRELDHIVVTVGKSKEGIDFQAHDGKPSFLFFTMLAPDSSAGAHLKTLARLSKLLKNDDVRDQLMQADSADDIYNIIITEDEKQVC